MDEEWITDYAILILAWPVSDNWDDEMRENFKKRVLAYAKAQIEAGYPIVEAKSTDRFFTDWELF